jgi:NADH-quinone oxidoreductase subunit F
MPQHTQTTRQPVPPVEPDLTVIDRLVAEIGTGPENLLALLQAVQDQWRYLPREALERLCDRAGLSPARVLGVATFYNQFRLRPAGRHTVNVCHGTACYVAGAAELTAALRRHLKLEDGEDTDAARLFTLQEVACLGCCSLAPVVQVDDRIYGHVTPGTVGQIVDDFLAHCEDRDDETPGPVPVPGTDGVVAFRIGLDSSSIASGSGAVREALQREIRRTGAAAVVQCVGCTGICHCDPLVEVSIPGGGRVFYANVAPTHVPALVRRHAPPANVTRRLLAAAQEAAGFFLGIAEEDTVSELDPRSTEVREFLAPQRRIVLEHAGRADPTDLELCREQGAWQALEHVLLAGDPQALIATVRESGLRGRGGAGVPTRP